MRFEDYWDMYTLQKIKDPDLSLTEKQIALMFWNALLAETFKQSCMHCKHYSNTTTARRHCTQGYCYDIVHEDKLRCSLWHDKEEK